MNEQNKYMTMTLYDFLQLINSKISKFRATKLNTVNHLTSFTEHTRTVFQNPFITFSRVTNNVPTSLLLTNNYCSLFSKLPGSVMARPN